MKNKPIIGIALFILFTTFISQNKITINKFKIKEIKIENNSILENQELTKIFSFLYNKNIIFLNSYKIKKKIDKQSFIEKFEIKRVIPDKLIIKVFEKEPVAIFKNQEKKKFYLGKKIDLIEYRKILKYENLPTVEGDLNSFKTLYASLIKIDFPTEIILSYHYFNANRWDIEMIDKKILKLPIKNYKKSLINFIRIKDKTNYDKYKIFDYRLNNQLILK